MMHTIKKHFYFVVAGYFAFWAGFVLRRWKPRVVLITGSSGKTTVLHLVEAQLGDQAVYTHHANSETGIALHILGMPTNVTSRAAWPKFFLLAPFHSFRRPPAQKLLIVEADCDRPREGAMTAKFINPEVVLWVSVFLTHSGNFDPVVQNKTFATHEAAIAYEFGNFAAAAQKLIIANGDQPLLVNELSRVAAGVKIIRCNITAVSSYTLSKSTTDFMIANQTIRVPGLHPKEVGVSVQLVEQLLTYLERPFDPSFTKFVMPPGRTNVLAGKRDTVLIDSTYNTSVDAVAAVLTLFDAYPSQHKWLILSDILEQGSIEQSEHERLATILSSHTYEKIVLLGPRMKQHTYPALTAAEPSMAAVCFEQAGEGLQYIEKHSSGGEAMLFKGARGLEGIVEQLLANPADAEQLVRREPVWVARRQEWGLPR